MISLHFKSVSIKEQIAKLYNVKSTNGNRLLPYDELFTLAKEAPQFLWDQVAGVPQSNYIMDVWALTALKTLSTGHPIYIYGPSGTGKSSFVRFVSSLFSIPLWEVTAHNRLETPELIGSYTLKGSETVWVDGPLTQAIRFGGLFLINEISLLDPATATGLNTILDGQPLLIPEINQVVPVHSNFRFIATDNTNGQGSQGLFLGTNLMNQALMSRFIMIESNYIAEVKEKQLIKNKVPLVTEDVLENLMWLASALRESVTNSNFDSLTNPPTTRDLIQAASMIMLYTSIEPTLGGKRPFYEGLKAAYLDRLNTSDLAKAKEIIHLKNLEEF